MRERGDAEEPEELGEAGGAPFGVALRRHRLEAGLTQEALAERAGVGVRTLQGLEAGTSAPLRGTARRLADGLGLPEAARARLLAASAPPPRAPRTPGPARGGLRLVPPPPARPALPPRGDLPAALSSFVGRQREVAEVARLLGGEAGTPAAPRLVTLTGPGGVGKTRLALEAAGALRPAYPDGVRLVELAALADPALVPQAAAAAAGIREQPGRSLLATLADALRPKRLLLVLDNCEHLLGASAALAEALLRACPLLRVLATSREALGLTGETRWRVPPLTLPSLPDDGPAPPAALADSEAVGLFAARAAEARPGFAVTDANAAAVARLCVRLDGIPLAIELAAARVHVLPPEQLLPRLDDRFRLLTGGSRAALERHQTLRAAVGWSYDLLAAPERALFRRLSVFAGGFTLEAAEAVGAGDEIEAGGVLDLLARLVDQSLVQAEEHAVDAGVARYRLLETLRQYAGERLAAAGGEAAGVRRRHAAHYLDLAERAEPGLRGPQQLAWLARLEVEHDNLRAALDWALESGEASPGLRLAAAVAWFWYLRRHLTEGRAWLAALLDAPGAAARDAPRARALGRAPWRGTPGTPPGRAGCWRRAWPWGASWGTRTWWRGRCCGWGGSTGSAATTPRPVAGSRRP